MTDVAFHFGTVDKVAYVSRLLRKATAAGERVLVLSDPITTEALDLALWNVSPTDFVTHCTLPVSDAMASRSSVVIAHQVPARGALPPFCVNLGQPAPSNLAQFGRLVEVVSTDEEDRQAARARWKHYSALGLTISRHDVSAAGTTV